MVRKKVSAFGRIDNRRAKKRLVETSEIFREEDMPDSDVKIEQKAIVSKRPQRKIPASGVGREGDRQPEKLVSNTVPIGSLRTPRHRKCDMDLKPRKTAPSPVDETNEYEETTVFTKRKRKSSW